VSNIHYLVCKLHLWDDFSITANGVEQRLWQPENSGIVGFIPVYEDREAAIAESGGQDIIALRISGEDGMFDKGGNDGNDEGS